MTNPIAILCSDIHLSHRPPVARSGEPSWYQAMEDTLGQLNDLQQTLNVPVICAGDVLDRWNSPPELINFAIRNLPKMYSIPGQHDLPNHSLKEMKRSAYWTLIEAGVLLDCVGPRKINDELIIEGFPWGREIEPWKDPRSMEERTDECILVVIHHYIWIPGHSYPNAPKEFNVSKWKTNLKGYDAAVFGDNHNPFQVKCGKCNVINTGTLMRRHANERDYQPGVGILHSNGTIKRHYFDTSREVFHVPNKKTQKNLDLSKFIQEMSELITDELDFRSAVERYLGQKGFDEDTKRIVLECLE